MRTCQKCGAEVEKGDKFCPECGEKVVKEARTITVWSVLKIVSIIIFLIILIHIFKNFSGASPVMLPILIILFIIWSGVLNWFLQKLFNVKISTGVKIAITVAIFLMLFFAANTATQKTTPIMVRPVEGNDMNMFIDRLNNVMINRDYGLLNSMMKEGTITSEVFEDLRIFMERQDFEIRFKFQGQNMNDNRIDAHIIVIIKTLYEERVEGVQFFFKETDRGWTLVAIEPRLSDLKISKSFEEETAYNLKKIPQPADASKPLAVKIASVAQQTQNDLACVTEPGKAIYGGTEKCCGGLKPMFGYEDSNGICHCTEEGNNCGGAPICAPCGNGICEKEYSEDRCTCPEDC